MTRYSIEMKYNAVITVTVDANDEGEALDKARNIAEEADSKEFLICEEQESRIVSQQGIG